MMKAWAYAAIVLAIVAGIGGTYAAGHKSGYEKRDGEVQQEIIAAQEETRKKEEARWRASVIAATKAIKTETIIEERIRVVEKEIPRVVEKIVEIKPQCRDLGTDYARLRNDQIRAANSGENAEAPAEPIGTLPGT